MKKTKIGVIGVGYLGRIHAAKYKMMDNVSLIGVTDVCRNTANDMANKLDTRAFNSIEELLNAVDAVSVVVPTRKHFEVGSMCLEHGVDLFLEKPMTTNIAEADSLLKKADICNRIVQVGHIERFNPAILAMEQYITKPIFIEAQRIHSFNSRGADVDVVLDLMIHDIDIILSIVNSPVKSMHSVGSPVITTSSDIANTRLIFENGCTANLSASRIAKSNTRKIKIFQADSYISVDYGKKSITVVSKNEQNKNSEQSDDKICHFSFPEKDALETELQAFVLNVQDRLPPKVDGAAGRRALKIALQVIAQMEAHRLEHKALFQ